MYFSIKRKGKTLAVGDDLLSFSIDYSISEVPSFRVTLPIKYYQHLHFRNEIIIKLDNHALVHGLINNKTIDKDAEVIDIQYDHILFEWSYESVPTNVVKKFKTIFQLYNDADIRYNGEPWVVRIRDDHEIDFEFSRETKLEALEKIVNLTPNLHYRVLRQIDRQVEIGKFGDIKDFPITFDNMLDNLIIDDDNSSIINYAVALSDKGDGGATSTTLRDVYLNPEYQLDGFPVIITGNLINTQSEPQRLEQETENEKGEKVTKVIDFPELAPNSTHEFAVLDEEGIRLEDGDIYEGTFTSNSIQPIQEDGKEISNEDRLKSSITLYDVAVRKSKQSRRKRKFETTVADLPVDINVGDRVPIFFNNTFSELCDGLGLRTATVIYERRHLYITDIGVDLDDGGYLVYQLKLSPDLIDNYRGREV